MFTMRNFLTLMTLLSSFLLSRVSAAEIRYKATIMPSSGAVRVTMEFEPVGKSTKILLPAWVPGFYMFLPHHKGITNFQASLPNGQLLQVTHNEARTWVVGTDTTETVKVSYTVAGNDQGLGFFGTHIRPGSGFINGGSAFMYLDGRKEEPISLLVNLPKGWDIATPMTGSEANSSFTAEGYDEFIDHPIQMGFFERRGFDISGTRFEAIYVSPNNRPAANLEAATERLKLLSIPAIRMMGGTTFKRYLYIIHLQVGDFEGGLEHRACNVIATGNVAPLNLDNLATHEYFHAWNVKQIRPKVLGPFEYQDKVFTDNLWFSEGVTDYYAYMHCYQSGVQNQEWLLKSLQEQFVTLSLSRTAKKMTLAECSRQAWLNGGLGVDDLSYYNKGLVCGMILDAAIRGNTKGARSLDHLMRYLYARHALPKPGFEETGILNGILDVIGGSANPDAEAFKKLYNQLVYTTDDAPAWILQSIGLRYIQPGSAVPYLGFEVNGVVVERVAPELEEMGLKRGDMIVTVNGEAVYRRVQFVGLGPTYKLKVMRGDKELDLNLKMLYRSADSYALEFDPYANTEARKRREEWLSRPKTR